MHFSDQGTNVLMTKGTELELSDVYTTVVDKTEAIETFMQVDIHKIGIFCDI